MIPALAMLQEAGTFREKFHFVDLPPAWILFLVIIPALAAFAWFVYRREKLDSPIRKILVFLRWSALLLLILLLFRPVMERVQVMIQKSKVLILLDDSASMQRKDSYPDETTREAVRFAAGLGEQEEPADFNRAELVARALGQQLLPDLQEKYETYLFRFSEGISPILDPAEAIGRGDRTRLGESLYAALEQHRGQFVQGILVISDGRSNEGRDPRAAAQSAATLGIPIHTVGVGDAAKPKNISVIIVEAPTIALEGDEITVSVRIGATGYSGRSVQLILEDPEQRAVLAEEVVDIQEGEGDLTSLTFTPEEAGEYRLKVSVPPLPEETLTDDNAASFTLRVRPEKIRVLYVEGRPRWEYRYLKEILRRTDRNLQMQVFLLSADRDFPQESSQGLTSLQTIPTSQKELLDRYDVIILGDVDPYSIAPTTELCEEFLQSVKGFVEKGGGFLMIAGEFDSPRSYEGTPIEDLLPVQLGKGEEDTLLPGDPIDKFNPLLETPTRPHEITRLHRDQNLNRTLWENEDEGLEGWYWYYPVRKPKPGAEVLLRHPRNRNRYGNHVLAAVTYFPEGRTMFLGVDEIWRWRLPFGDTYAERFWKNSIRYLALNRLRGEDRRYRLATEKATYELNERAVLEARVLNEDFAPSKEPSQKVFLQFPDGHIEEILLELVPGQPGVFRTSILLGAPGRYLAKLTEGGDPQGKSMASVDFEAVIPSRELSNPSLDEKTLKEVARISGGQYLALGNLEDLGTFFSEGGEIEIPVLPPDQEDLWDNAWLLGLIVLILACEWILRKRSLLI